jgi:hypothetical protein
MTLSIVTPRDSVYSHLALVFFVHLYEKDTVYSHNLSHDSFIIVNRLFYFLQSSLLYH